MLTAVLLANSNPMSGTIQIIALYAAVIGVMWFFLMRPQRKKQKEHDSLVATVEAGDSILTNSGFYGVVIDVSDEVVIVEFGNNKNCRIPMKKDAIAEIEKVEEK